MIKVLGLAAAVLCMAGGEALAADSLKRLAKKLEKGLSGEPVRKVAVLGFPYPDGKQSSGSTVVQERLTTFLAEDGRVQVVERQLLVKILEEKKLAQTGILDPKLSQEIGKVLGVNTLVTGTLNDVGKETEINARAIDADTGRILSAGQATVARTWEPGTTAIVHHDSVLPYKRGSLAQIAILIDTSSSMDGLISQAKTQLWKIVNEIAAAKKRGEAPAVQVALYEYGNDGLSARENYLRQILPFTTDLDQLSERLFALTTNGGSEFAGAAIRHAVDTLAWSADPGAYKTIFIAGNEPFQQGPVHFREAIAAAVKKGVFVNTVFCGGREEGVRTEWLAGAQLGGGEFLNIDQDHRVAVIRAPQDDEITRLSMELNTTFVPMGSRGKARAELAKRQDANAASVRGGADVERAAFKAAPQYEAAASAWDAISAIASGGLSSAQAAAAPAALPAEVQEMKEEDRKAYLDGQVAKRKDLQARMQKLQAERAEYLKKNEQAGAKSTLGQAVIEAVRRQASKKGYTFKS